MYLADQRRELALTRSGDAAPRLDRAARRIEAERSRDGVHHVVENDRYLRIGAL